MRLKSILVDQIAKDEPGPDDTQIIELKRQRYGAQTQPTGEFVAIACPLPTNTSLAAFPVEADTAPNYFLLVALKVIGQIGYQLETTLLMARPLSLGPLGFGARRELLVFKNNRKV